MGTKLKLWLIDESELARRYTKVPPERGPEREDMFWVPKSIIEHTTKFGNQHVVTLPDWFIEKNGL